MARVGGSGGVLPRFVSARITGRGFPGGRERVRMNPIREGKESAMGSRASGWRWAALAAGAFLLLMGVEVATEDELEWAAKKGNLIQEVFNVDLVMQKAKTNRS